MQLGKSSLLLWSNEEMTIFLFHPRGRSCPQMPQNEVVLAPGPMRWPYQADLPLHGGLKFREFVVDSLPPPSYTSLNLKKKNTFLKKNCIWVSWCAINHTHLYDILFTYWCTIFPVLIHYTLCLPPSPSIWVSRKI